MDATLSDAQRLSDGPASVPPKARLPGEDASIARGDVREPIANPSEARAESRHRRSTKSVLMSTVGVVFLMGAVGAMGYAQRAELERLPIVQHYLPDLRHAVASIHVPAFIQASKAPVLTNGASPSVAHTTIAVPGAEILAGHHAAQTSPVASIHSVAPPPANAPVVQAKTPGTMPKPPNATDTAKTELAQFDAFHATPVPSATGAQAKSPAPAPAAVKSTGEPAAAVAAKAAHPSSADQVASPAMASENASAPAVTQATKTTGGQGSANKLTGAAMASNSAPPSTAQVTAAPQPAPAPAVAPAAVLGTHAPQLTPVAQAVALQAAPMTPQQQVNVLHLVMELGVLIRDQKTEIAALHDQVSKLSGTVNGKLTDFDRRLSLAEANGAIAAAMGAPTAQPPAQNAGALAATAQDPAPALRRDRTVAKPKSETPASDVIQRSVADYHIQAASPGLAMLSVAGSAPLEIAIGDEVPGVGRVKAIVQNGTSWEVQTDHGTIQ